MNVLCCYESWLLQAVEERKVSTKKIRFLVVFSLLGSCRVLELQAQSQEKYQLVKCRKGVFVLPSCDLACLFIYCLPTSHCNALDLIKLLLNLLFFHCILSYWKISSSMQLQNLSIILFVI